MMLLSRRDDAIGILCNQRTRAQGLAQNVRPAARSGNGQPKLMSGRGLSWGRVWRPCRPTTKVSAEVDDNWTTWLCIVNAACPVIVIRQVLPGGLAEGAQAL